MDPLDKLTIDTPEQTALEFPLAGVGSRFVAMLADTAIQVVIGFVLFFALTLSIPALTRVASIASQWIIAAMIVSFFVIYYGYFAIFEALWNGQTPGKRYTQLRVMKDDGRPISPYDAIARNLLRIVDQLPIFYGVAMISVFCSKQNKRLGDFVAGLVVSNGHGRGFRGGSVVDGAVVGHNCRNHTPRRRACQERPPRRAKSGCRGA